MDSDAFRQIFEYGVILRSGVDTQRCREAIGALHRFAADATLEARVRELASALLREFGRK